MPYIQRALNDLKVVLALSCINKKQTFSMDENLSGYAYPLYHLEINCLDCRILLRYNPHRSCSVTCRLFWSVVDVCWVRTDLSRRSAVGPSPPNGVPGHGGSSAPGTSGALLDWTGAHLDVSGWYSLRTKPLHQINNCQNSRCLSRSTDRSCLHHLWMLVLCRLVSLSGYN